VKAIEHVQSVFGTGVLPAITEVEMLKSIALEVTGPQRMVCEGCENRVVRLLKTLQGVGQVRAEARNQRIEVLFDAAVLEPDVIAERLREAGYETRAGGSTSDSGNRTSA